MCVCVCVCVCVSVAEDEDEGTIDELSSAVSELPLTDSQTCTVSDDY